MLALTAIACGWIVVALRLKQRFYHGDPRTLTAIALWPLWLAFYVASIAIALGYARLARGAWPASHR